MGELSPDSSRICQPLPWPSRSVAAHHRAGGHPVRTRPVALARRPAAAIGHVHRLIAVLAWPLRAQTKSAWPIRSRRRPPPLQAQARDGCRPARRPRGPGQRRGQSGVPSGFPAPQPGPGSVSASSSRSGWMALRVRRPSVRVPVLSSTRVSIWFRPSSTWPRVSNMPSLCSEPVAAVSAVGVANARAQGRWRPAGPGQSRRRAMDRFATRPDQRWRPPPAQSARTTARLDQPVPPGAACRFARVPAGGRWPTAVWHRPVLALQSLAGLRRSGCPR